MKEIPLTQGKVAIVSDCDYEWLSQYKWQAMRGYKETFYAAHAVRPKVGKRGYIYMHRLILDAPDGMQVDHVNGDGLDNRRQNLRLATNAENRRNTRIAANNTSGCKGVCWDKVEKKWIAQIGINGRTRRIGRFDFLLDAALAYDRAAMAHYGEFANVNFPRLHDNGTGEA